MNSLDEGIHPFHEKLALFVLPDFAFGKTNTSSSTRGNKNDDEEPEKRRVLPGRIYLTSLSGATPFETMTAKASVSLKAAMYPTAIIPGNLAFP